VLVFRRSRRVIVISETAGSLPFRIPAFPQGTLPIYWSHLLLPYVLYPHWRDEPLVDLGSWGYAVVSAVSIALLSLLAAWMFSARPRAQRNLEWVAEVPEEPYEPQWRRQLLQTTLLLALVEAGIVLSGALFSEGAATVLVYLTGAMMLVATGLDLYDEGLLSARSGPLERVLTLDNVHLAEYFQALLAQEEIPCVVRALHFRRLSYFLGSLFKMALLVPAADAKRAARLLDETPFRIV
jgi:hypothetical protein